MADIQINDLPLLPLSLVDELEVQRAGGGESGKLRVQDIVNAVPDTLINWGDIGGILANQVDLQAALNGKADQGAQDTAVWGQITGTLAAQTDLQNALNAKANSDDVYTRGEVDALLAGKLDTTGGTINGTLTVTGNIVSNADVQAFQP